MRILQLISSAGFYGAESLVVSLSEALCNLGHDVQLASILNEQNPNSEVADRARAAGLKTEVIPCGGRFDIRALRNLKALIARFGPSIVHSHGYKADIYSLMTGARRYAAVVATCHNWTNSTRVIRAYTRLDQFALRRFDRVFCVSPPVQEALQRSGVPPSKTAVILNGIDTSRFEKAAPTLERRPGSVLIGMVGRLVREKGVHLALIAAASVLRRFPEAHFVFVGDGPGRAEFGALAASSGISSNVSFLGARADMPGVYRSLDMFVLPSLNEGMPMSLLEAMSAGVPVIATRVGAIPDIVEHGRNGLLIDAGDAKAIGAAIERLLSEPDEMSRMARGGQEWTRENASILLTAETYVRQYEDLIRERAYALGAPA